MTARVVSFDVFDTVLTRRVGEPTAVFRLAGRLARARGLTVATESEFVAIRRAAETTCRQRHPEKEVTLVEICLELAARLGGDAELGQKLSEIELAAEHRLICAVPGAREVVDSARQRHDRILFVSDMYLPAEFLRERLTHFGFLREGDRLYLSGEVGVTKHGGGLFRHVLAAEKLPADQLSHRGNHAVADMTVPAGLGIAIDPFTAANPNRYETTLERFATKSAGVASALAGASRLARLAVPANNAQEAEIRDVAAGVAGPVLAAYVGWVLRTARARGIGRLYFVARDGRLLLELARSLAPKLHPAAELRYLHGSRNAWHLAALGAQRSSPLSWLFASADFLSLATVARLLQVEPRELAGANASDGGATTTLHANLPATERMQLLARLQAPPLADLVSRQAQLAAERLIAYLRQEGLFDPVGSALVDVGWHGRAQDSLASVIRDAGGTPPPGFYFGLNSGSGQPGLGDRAAWFFDRRPGGDGSRALPGLEALIEVFCTSTEGSTLGYDLAGERVVPRLGPTRRDLDAWGWPVLQATVAAFGREFTDTGEFDSDENAIRTACLAVLQEFWERPTPTEAAAWGAFPYEDDQTAAGAVPLAAPLPWAHALAIARRAAAGPHRAAWWQGSLALTPAARRNVLRPLRSLRLWLRAARRSQP